MIYLDVELDLYLYLDIELDLYPDLGEGIGKMFFVCFSFSMENNLYPHNQLLRFFFSPAELFTVCVFSYLTAFTSS